MNLLKRIASGLVGFVRSLDPKLVAPVLTTAVGALVARIGFDAEDPLVVLVLPLAIGSVVGYFWPNDGTLLREGIPASSDQDSGGVELPPDLEP